MSASPSPQARRVALFSADPTTANHRAVRMMGSLADAGYRVTLFTEARHTALAPDRVDAVGCLTDRDGRLRVAPMPDLSGFDIVQVAGRQLLGAVSPHVPRTTKLIYDVPEAEPDEGGGSWLDGIKVKVGAWRSAPRIDTVLCPGYVFGEYLQREMQLKAVPVVPIYPAYPYVEHIVPDNAFWGQKGRPAVAVLGGDVADMEPAVAAVGRLRDVDLVAINVQGDWGVVERLAEPYRFAGRLHRIEVPEDRLLGTVATFRMGLVLPVDASQQSLYDIPPSLFMFLMAGVPVVTSDLPGIARLVVAQNFGLMAEPTNHEQLADQIGRACTDNLAWERLCHNVNVVRRQRYSWEVQEKRLLTAYARLAGDTAPNHAKVGG